MVLADTGEAVDKKERKDLHIETMDKFINVKTQTNGSMFNRPGLAGAVLQTASLLSPSPSHPL